MSQPITTTCWRVMSEVDSISGLCILCRQHALIHAWRNSNGDPRMQKQLQSVSGGQKLHGESWFLHRCGQDRPAYLSGTVILLQYSSSHRVGYIRQVVKFSNETVFSSHRQQTAFGNKLFQPMCTFNASIEWNLEERQTTWNKPCIQLPCWHTAECGVLIVCVFKARS